MYQLLLYGIHSNVNAPIHVLRVLDEVVQTLNIDPPPVEEERPDARHRIVHTNTSFNRITNCCPILYEYLDLVDTSGTKLQR